MRTYHYYASARLPDKWVQLDGIVRLQQPIRGIEDYRHVKDLICQGDEADLKDKLVIESLSIVDED